MFFKLIIVNLIISPLSIVSVEPIRNYVRGSRVQRYHPERELKKEKKLEVELKPTKDKEYKKLEMDVKFDFNNKKNTFNLTYTMLKGPENCGDDKITCKLVIMNSNTCDAVDSDDHFYDGKKDPYQSKEKDFEFSSTDNGEAIGQLDGLDIGYSEDDIKGHAMVLLGPPARKSKKSGKEEIIACGIITAD